MDWSVTRFFFFLFIFMYLFLFVIWLIEERIRTLNVSFENIKKCYLTKRSMVLVYLNLLDIVSEFKWPPEGYQGGYIRP